MFRVVSCLTSTNEAAVVDSARQDSVSSGVRSVQRQRHVSIDARSSAVASSRRSSVRSHTPSDVHLLSRTCVCVRACLHPGIVDAPHKHLDGTDRQTSYRSRTSDALSRLHAAITPGTHVVIPKCAIICTEVTHERITANEYVRSISKVSTAGERTCARQLHTCSSTSRHGPILAAVV